MDHITWQMDHHTTASGLAAQILRRRQVCRQSSMVQGLSSVLEIP